MSDKELFSQIESATYLNLPDIAEAYERELNKRYGNGKLTNSGSSYYPFVGSQLPTENSLDTKHFQFSDDTRYFGNKKAVAERIKQMTDEGKSDEEITSFILRMGMKPEYYY